MWFTPSAAHFWCQLRVLELAPLYLAVFWNTLWLIFVLRKVIFIPLYLYYYGLLFGLYQFCWMAYQWSSSCYKHTYIHRRVELLTLHSCWPVRSHLNLGLYLFVARWTGAVVWKETSPNCLHLAGNLNAEPLGCKPSVPIITPPSITSGRSGLPPRVSQNFLKLTYLPTLTLAGRPCRILNKTPNYSSFLPLRCKYSKVAWCWYCKVQRWGIGVIFLNTPSCAQLPLCLTW